MARTSRMIELTFAHGCSPVCEYSSLCLGLVTLVIKITNSSLITMWWGFGPFRFTWMSECELKVVRHGMWVTVYSRLWIPCICPVFEDDSLDGLDNCRWEICLFLFCEKLNHQISEYQTFPPLGAFLLQRDAVKSWRGLIFLSDDVWLCL